MTALRLNIAKFVRLNIAKFVKMENTTLLRAGSVVGYTERPKKTEF